MKTEYFRFSWLMIFILLTACGASPAPEFMGAKRSDITHDGRQYTIFYTANRVEVIRLGYASRAEQQQIRSSMISIIPQVTGCVLVEGSLQGDSGEARGSIDCGL
ncbi:MAG: hypothetical protein ABIO62_07315 [Paracoccaceae bacterium]